MSRARPPKSSSARPSRPQASWIASPSEAQRLEYSASLPLPGRGLLARRVPLEFQAALPVAGENEQEASHALSELMAGMTEETEALLKASPDISSQLPTKIGVLPTRITARTFTEAGHIAMDYKSLTWRGLSLQKDGPAFMVLSVSPRCGKTTLLHSWMLSEAQQQSPEQLRFVLIDYHSRALGGLRGLAAEDDYIGSQEELADAIKRLNAEIQRRAKDLDEKFKSEKETFDADREIARWPTIAIVIDDYAKLAMRDEKAGEGLAELLVKGNKLGLSFVIAANVSEMSSSPDSFYRKLNKYGTGYLLGGYDGIELFNGTKRPVGHPAAGMNPGRGFLVRLGRAELVQVACYWEPDQDARACLNEQVRKLERSASPKGGRNA